MRRQLQNSRAGDWLDITGRWSWEPTFSLLASARQVAYQIGGMHAFSKELPVKAKPPAETQILSAEPVLQSKQIALNEFGLIIGAMKCGTSALFRTLTGHPQVAPCKMKEPSFFISENEFTKGKLWYESLFPYDPGIHKIGVEATTRNTMLPAYKGCAERMQRTHWAFKFVYIVRNPFERIQSHYMDAAVRYPDIPPLSEGLHPFPLNVSSYHMQLQPFESVFGRASILVASHDDLVSTFSDTFARICDHFQISRVPHVIAESVHTGEYHYHRELLIREIKSKQATPSDLSLDTVHEYLLTLSSGARESIESSVKARLTLTDKHKAQIKSRLAEEMKLLHRDYEINVEQWGF
jgi:hypothetical protein